MGCTQIEVAPMIVHVVVENLLCYLQGRDQSTGPS